MNKPRCKNSLKDKIASLEMTCESRRLELLASSKRISDYSQVILEITMDHQKIQEQKHQIQER